jgi:integrase
MAAVNSAIKPIYGVVMLLYLQGGMMVSEIKRLRPDDIGLDADIPHLKIVNNTKTDDRKRIVPIVLGLDLIKDNIEATIKWLQGTTESAPSATLKKIMRRTIDSPRTSPHCLRHSFKINGQNAGVSLLTIASIAGWSDEQRRASKYLLKYGSTGISQSAIMRTLYEDSLKIHKHLIDIKYVSSSNVVSINSRS